MQIDLKSNTINVIYLAIPKTVCPHQSDIALVVDSSGSMTMEDYYGIQHCMKQLGRALNVHPTDGDRVAYITFARTANITLVNGVTRIGPVQYIQCTSEREGGGGC